MRNGQALKQKAWVLAGDLEAAHQRLATADPRIYLPLPVSRQHPWPGHRMQPGTPR